MLSFWRYYFRKIGVGYAESCNIKDINCTLKQDQITDYTEGIP
jgi:hypothetical protein